MHGNGNVDCTPQVNVLSLCSGAGSLELGLRLAIPSARAICYVEREAFACSVLEARMRDNTLDEAPIWTDVKTFDGKPWNGVVDIVTAGWPCQPFSTMGKRKGVDDARHLWPSVSRIINECNPIILFGENVARHISVGFDQVVKDLRGMGYACEAGLFSATEVGAPHIRARLFILAYSSGQHGNIRQFESLCRKSIGGRNSGMDASSCGTIRLARQAAFPPGRNEEQDWKQILGPGNSTYQPAFFNVADELALEMGEPIFEGREEQFRLVGNGVVPSCAAYAFEILLQRAISRSSKKSSS